MRMHRTLALVACFAATTSCSTLESLSSTNVPVKSIIVAANTVDAAESTATAYLKICTPVPAPKGCDDALIQNKIIPAVKAIRAARTAAEDFVAANPNATLGPATLVSAISTAVTTLQQIVSSNAVVSTTGS